jgi:hypothetical protein
MALTWPGVKVLVRTDIVGKPRARRDHDHPLVTPNPAQTNFAVAR